MSVISVIFTGGTISMTVDPTTGDASPSLTGDSLLGAISDTLPPVRIVDWAKMPASQFQLSDVLDIARTIQREADDTDVDGVVVVQGTDSLDETAFAWDVLVNTDVPVVVVGAMLNASQPGFDGTRNLRDAIMIASDRRLCGRGVVVSMAGEIHGADDVTKTHTTSYTTFQSPNFGPIGIVSSDGVHVARTRTPVRLPSIPRTARSRVAIVLAALGLHDADLAAVAGADGVVVSAMGSGNTDVRILRAAQDWLAAGTRVVLTSRCPSGRVTKGYGFEGGSSTWHEAGAIFAGTLSPLKARILLGLGIELDLEPDELADLFTSYGGGR